MVIVLGSRWLYNPNLEQYLESFEYWYGPYWPKMTMKWIEWRQYQKALAIWHGPFRWESFLRV